MLFAVIRQLGIDPIGAIITLLVFVLALVISISVHEFCHALIATRLGDTTPKAQGRLTLHPRAHLDPVGSLMILFAGFGWGKPVQVNPRGLRTDPRSGMAAISLAGPLSNLILAAIMAIPFRMGVLHFGGGGLFLFSGNYDALPSYLLGTLLFLNLLLAVFNLIPLAPLDGFKVALGILPLNMSRSFARLERHGPVILLVVILIDIALPVSILSRVIFPPVQFLLSVFIG